MGKEEIPVTRIFYFSNNVFKRSLLQGCLNSGLCGKDLTHSQTTNYSLFLTQTFCNQQLQPFPKGQILDSSKLKEFADDNSKFDENGRKFSKSVENTVGNGEIALYEQFLLFSQCFQKTLSANT